jgi:hypothetical protein
MALIGVTNSLKNVLSDVIAVSIFDDHGSTSGLP